MTFALGRLINRGSSKVPSGASLCLLTSTLIPRGTPNKYSAPEAIPTIDVKSCFRETFGFRIAYSRNRVFVSNALPL